MQPEAFTATAKKLKQLNPQLSDDAAFSLATQFTGGIALNSQGLCIMRLDGAEVLVSRKGVIMTADRPSETAAA